MKLSSVFLFSIIIGFSSSLLCGCLSEQQRAEIARRKAIELEAKKKQEELNTIIKNLASDKVATRQRAVAKIVELSEKGDSEAFKILTDLARNTFGGQLRDTPRKKRPKSWGMNGSNTEICPLSYIERYEKRKEKDRYGYYDYVEVPVWESFNPDKKTAEFAYNALWKMVLNKKPNAVAAYRKFITDWAIWITPTTCHDYRIHAYPYLIARAIEMANASATDTPFYEILHLGGSSACSCNIDEYADWFFDKYLTTNPSDGCEILRKILCSPPLDGIWVYRERAFNSLKLLAKSGKEAALVALTQIAKNETLPYEDYEYQVANKEFMKNKHLSIDSLIELQKNNPSPRIHSAIMEVKNETNSGKFYEYIEKNYLDMNYFDMKIHTSTISTDNIGTGNILLSGDEYFPEEGHKTITP